MLRKFTVQNTEYRVQSMEFRVQSTECRVLILYRLMLVIQSTEYRVQGTDIVQADGGETEYRCGEFKLAGNCTHNVRQDKYLTSRSNSIGYAVIKLSFNSVIRFRLTLL